MAQGYGPTRAWIVWYFQVDSLTAITCALGAIAKMSPIMGSVIEFANNGGYVLGVCNGFQILTESGLLPGALTPQQQPQVHL